MVKRQAKGRPNFNFPEKPKSRRETRKDERREKKQKKNSFYMKRTAGKIFSALGLETPDAQSFKKQGKDNPSKNLKEHELSKLGADVKKSAKEITHSKKGEKQPQKSNAETANSDKKKFENHLKEMERTRKKQLRDENKREEKIIKQLEKRLHLNKRKSKALPKSFVDDGLDYILDICDSEKRGALAKEESAFFNDESGSDAEPEHDEDVRKAKKQKADKKKTEDKMESGSDDEEDDAIDEDISDEIDDDVEGLSADEAGSEEEGDDEESAVEDENEEVDEIEDEDEIMDEEDKDVPDDGDNQDDESEEVQESDEDNKKTEVWEDIYGRLRDKQGNVVTNAQASSSGKYIPPALRGKTSDADVFDAQEKARLLRTLKGLLNRLSDSNLPSIADQIETLYGNHSRSLVNGSIFELTFEMVVSPVPAPDRLIMVHCLLIATLHANVGPEIGAKFLENLSQQLQNGFEDTGVLAEENKTLDNLLWLFSSLYMYKVIAASTMYSLLRRLVDRFTVKDVELILLALRNVGFMLRKDDPMALKEMIAKIQLKVSQSESMKEQPRVRFMLETLAAIKNNNMSKIRQYDPEQIEHFRKVLRNAVRKGSSVTTLNVTYDELIDSSNRGRWWLVGSAWTNEGKSGNAVEEETTKVKQSEANRYSQKLLDLAAKMRMNTDVRRNIFCVLMSADDYLEAFEQLLRVNLSAEQRKEIIYVTLECCLREKIYNPYYAALALKFATYDRTYQMTLQFAFWDKLKELHSLESQQMTNLARFFCTVIEEKGLPISALKAVNFAEIDKTTVKFLKEILIPLLINTSEITLREIFGRLVTQNKLKLFKEGLKLFLSHFVAKEAAKRTESEGGKLLQRIRIADESMYGGSNL